MVGVPDQIGQFMSGEKSTCGESSVALLVLVSLVSANVRSAFLPEADACVDGVLAGLAGSDCDDVMSGN